LRSELFKSGEITEVLDIPVEDVQIILDLYHNQDVDPRAIAISFKQLAESHPEAELKIVAMEKRGGNNLLLRAATTADANHSKLSAEYCATYNKLKALAGQEPQALLEEKNRRIHSLETMVAKALQRPSFYAKTYQNNGGTISERKISIDQSSASIGVSYSENVNTEQVGGTQHNYAPEQKQTLAEAAAEIQKLLQQLEQTNPSATEAEQIEHINDETTPKFKKRVVGALQASGEAAIDEFVLENKYLKVVKAAVKGWIRPE
jgi:hypothetical protein